MLVDAISSRLKTVECFGKSPVPSFLAVNLHWYTEHNGRLGSPTVPFMLYFESATGMTNVSGVCRQLTSAL
jgi:hypothetical protein